MYFYPISDSILYKNCQQRKKQCGQRRKPSTQMAYKRVAPQVAMVTNFDFGEDHHDDDEDDFLVHFNYRFIDESIFRPRFEDKMQQGTSSNKRGETPPQEEVGTNCPRMVVTMDESDSKYSDMNSVNSRPSSRRVSNGYHRCHQ